MKTTPEFTFLLVVFGIWVVLTALQALAFKRWTSLSWTICTIICAVLAAVELAGALLWLFNGLTNLGAVG